MKDKKFFTGLIIILVLIIIYIVYTFGFKPTDVRPQNPSPKQLTVWATSLYESYQQNYRQADAHYLDKRLIIHGNFTRYKKDSEQIIVYFIYEKEKFGEEGVRCYFSVEDLNTIEKIKDGQAISVKGKCVGFDDKFVNIANCSLIQKK
ncbi:MAG: hypothetical protein ACEPOW_12010 [Bacteroidales bacterium]